MIAALSSDWRDRPGFHNWYNAARPRPTPMLMVCALWNLTWGGHVGLWMWVSFQSAMYAPTMVPPADKEMSTLPTGNFAALRFAMSFSVRPSLREQGAAGSGSRAGGRSPRRR